MKTTTNQKTNGTPSPRILKAFQVICDVNKFVCSKWVNPSLKVLPNCNEKSIHFFVYCKSILFAYGHTYIELSSVYIGKDVIQILYTLNKRFDSLYDYDSNPKNKK